MLHCIKLDADPSIPIFFRASGCQPKQSQLQYHTLSIMTSTRQTSRLPRKPISSSSCYVPPPNHPLVSPTGLIGLKNPSSTPSLGLPTPALPLCALGPLAILSRVLALLCSSGLSDKFLAGARLPTARVVATGSESEYRGRVSSQGPVMGEVA